MGREIRRVAPNWEHPKKESGDYHPMYDESYEDARQKWLDELQQWLAGENEYQDNGYQDNYDYWEYAGNPPERDYYRPSWAEDEMTWYQVYETVSEGTPITPPFATKEELVHFLTTHKDFWDQGPHSEETARKFVDSGRVPSGIVHRTETQTQIFQGIECVQAAAKE